MIEIVGVALLVPNYDEAIKYYTNVIGLKLIHDFDLGNGERAVWIAASDTSEVNIHLVLAVTPEQLKVVGNQAGECVFLSCHTTSLQSDFERLRSKGVEFEGKPHRGILTEFIDFKDRYGNRWHLSEYKGKK